MSKSVENEDEFEEEGYYEEELADECCPSGYAVDECDGEGMAGIESCEFCCPWGKVAAYFKRVNSEKGTEQK
jgi:hypothetical protein